MITQDTQKTYTARKATGVSVEEFYAAQDEAMKKVKGEPKYSTGQYINLTNYSCLTLARVEPMPTYEEFKNFLDEDIAALVDECKAQNPRHWKSDAEPVDEKKSET
jgi:hypothetical protein